MMNTRKEIEELSEKPLWENEDELAMLCGLR